MISRSSRRWRHKRTPRGRTGYRRGRGLQVFLKYIHAQGRLSEVIPEDASAGERLFLWQRGSGSDHAERGIPTSLLLHDALSEIPKANVLPNGRLVFEDKEVKEDKPEKKQLVDIRKPLKVPKIEELERYMSIIEGILFAMGNSVEVEQIANALSLNEEEVYEILDYMAAKYEYDGRGIRLLKLENAYQMCTATENYEYLIQIAKQPKKHVLTDVLLETLSIIAYKQPVTKAEIEKIRGVSCDHAVSKLVEYQLVEELGRLDAPGRPMLFGTTEDFLRSFGVTSLAELPVLNPVQVEEFKLQAEAEANETLSVEI